MLARQGAVGIQASPRRPAYRRYALGGAGIILVGLPLIYFVVWRTSADSPQAKNDAEAELDQRDLIGRWVIANPPAAARYYPQEVDIAAVRSDGSVAGNAAVRENENTVVTDDLKLEKRVDFARHVSKEDISAAITASASLSLPSAEQWQLQIRGRQSFLAYAVTVKPDRTSIELFDTSNRIAHILHRRAPNAKDTVSLDDWRTPKVKRDERVELGPWGFTILSVETKEHIKYGSYEVQVDKNSQIVEFTMRCEALRQFTEEEEKTMIALGRGDKSAFDDLRAKNIQVLTSRRFQLQYQPGGKWAPGQWHNAELVAMIAEPAHNAVDSGFWRSEIPIGVSAQLQIAFVVEPGGKNFEFIFTPLAHVPPRHGSRAFNF